MVDDFIQRPHEGRLLTLSVIFCASSSPLVAIAVVTLVARLVLRIRNSTGLGLDDGFIVLGFLFTLAQWLMLLVPLIQELKEAARGDEDYIILQVSAREISFVYYSFFPWCLAMGTIKISIALTLLRFLKTLPWRLLLFFMIFMQVVIAGLSIGLSAARCPPPSYEEALDRLAPPGMCGDNHQVTRATGISVGAAVATDIILTFIPLTFVLRLRRPRRERILVSLLIVLGLSASVASIWRIVIVYHYDDPLEHPGAVAISSVTWGTAELLIGIIAANMPMLKRPVQAVLEFFGVPLTAKREQRPLDVVFEPSYTSTAGALTATDHSGAPIGLGLEMSDLPPSRDDDGTSKSFRKYT